MCCITVTRSQFLHVLVLALHEYSRTRDTVITCAYLWYWILLVHVLVDLLHYASIWLFYSYLLSHRFTFMHAMLVFVFSLSWTLFILYGLLLHEYSCILVTWLFSVTDIDILVTRHVSYWYAICGIPHLLFPVSRYLVLCYQQSSCPIIMLHVPCTVWKTPRGGWIGVSANLEYKYKTKCAKCGS